MESSVSNYIFPFPIKIKIKLHVIIGLILNYPLLFKMQKCPPQNITEISILPSINEMKIPNYNEMKIPNPINLKDIINNLQISTDMPDF